MDPSLPLSPPSRLSIPDLVLHADPVVQAVLMLLAVCSILCWSIILEKTLRLISFNRQVRELEAVAREGATISAGSSLAHGIVIAASKVAISGNEPRLETETRLERAMRLAARVDMIVLQSRVRLLATVGSTAPFVGLFGTVWGIMNSFSAIAQQKDTSLAIVAPGIAEALFATALGLVAAIPAVVAYNQISGMIARTAERVNMAIAMLSPALAHKRHCESNAARKDLASAIAEQ